MKNRSIFIIFLGLMYLNTHSQQWQWAKGFGPGGGVDILTDNFHNIYLLSVTGSGFSYGGSTLSCGNTGTLAKHDSLGNLIWARGFNFQVNHFAMDKIGNIYVTGLFNIWSSNTPNYFCGGNNPNIQVTSQGGADMFICKYDNNGNLLWAKTWDNSGGNENPTISKTDGSGNTIIAGYSSLQANQYGPPKLDHFLLKYDAQGNLIWNKTNNYKGSMLTKSLDIDTQGNIYLAGHFQDTAYFNNIMLTNNGPSTVYIAKYNASGTIIWAKKDGTGYDECNGICLDKKGHFYITGTATSLSVFSGTTLANNGMFVAKYDTSGNGLWAKSTKGNQGIALTVDSSGACFITGVFSGSLISSANPPSNLYSQNPQIFVTKYNKLGSEKWSVAPVSSGNYFNNSASISCNIENNCFLTGSYNNNTNFGSSTLISNGIFIAKLNNSSANIIAKKKEYGREIYECTIYPNPTSGKTTFNYVLANDTKTAEIKLTDLFGQPVSKLSLNPGSRSIDTDVSGLTNGLYFYTLYVNGTAVDSKKLVLSK